jgi:hypothetical protein
MATTAPSPIVTPSVMPALAPIHTSAPIVIPREVIGCSRIGMPAAKP